MPLEVLEREAGPFCLSSVETVDGCLVVQGAVLAISIFFFKILDRSSAVLSSFAMRLSSTSKSCIAFIAEKNIWFALAPVGVLGRV